MIPLVRRASVAALVLAAAPAAAADRLVPSQYATVQAAIDAAANGDAIVVSPGTYRENLVVDGKNVTIRSLSGDPADTILDGSGASTSSGGEATVAFVGNSRATIGGLTIKGGNGYNATYCVHTGGGVCVDGASPTIEGNVITGNRACGGGNGLSVVGGSPVIRRNRIVSNTGGSCSGGGAGGCGVKLEGGSATVVDNLIASNDCAMNGGGVAASAGTHRLERNVIRDNHSWGYGGAIATDINGLRQSLTLTITGNLIHGNRAEKGVGGLYFYTGSATMAGNTVAQNGGIQLYAADWGPSVTSVDDLVDGSAQCVPSGVITFRNTLVSGAATGCAFTPGQDGNRSASPRFVASSVQDFHLRPDSPAVDAGVSHAALASLDLDGEARTIGSAPDLGADEHAGLVSATFDPLAQDHGPAKVGTVGPPVITTITNGGASPLRVSPPTSSSSEFSVAGNGCVTPDGIAPGASCTISVVFRPTVKGPRSATVTVESNALGWPHAIAVSGLATAPVIALDAGALDFGDVRTHTSAARTITVTNTGDAPSTGLVVAATGGFTATNGCAGGIAPGATCAIGVGFAPAARGEATGKITVTGDGYNLPVEATLRGRGVAPVFQASAASVGFGAVKVGATASQVLTISNAGELPLVLSELTASGDFASAGGCGASVAPGASCELGLGFTPTRGGDRAGELRIVHDADGSPATIALAGVGQDFALTAYPSAVSVPPGAVVQMSALVSLQGGWSDPVSLSCEGLPSPGRCLLAPEAFTPSGPTEGIAVELHTSSATLAAVGTAGVPLALAGIVLVPGGALAAGRARRRRLAFLALAAAAALLGACSGGGSGGVPGPGPGSGSGSGSGGGQLAPGTYTVTIRATSAGVQRTATVALTVTSAFTSPY